MPPPFDADRVLETFETATEENQLDPFRDQELIHGEHFDEKGREGSWEMLYNAAELKCDFPEQVHFLFANHDLAQIHGEGIMKAGLSVCEAFTAGIKREFGTGATMVNVAITEFLLSLPLAIRAA